MFGAQLLIIDSRFQYQLSFYSTFVNVMKRISAFLLSLCLLLGALNVAPAKEVQNHGVVFEQWIRDTFFESYKPESYTQKWDIPAKANKKFGGIAVNPKATKYKGAVDMGDALRQFDIDEPFWLVIGYWQQEGENKRFVNVVAQRIEPADWRKLWGDLDRADLERLDAVIKATPDYKEARVLAQAIKREPKFKTSIITLNPKIDSKSQRRLQCSLSWSKVFKYLAPDANSSAQEKPLLWGVPVDIEVASAPRSFEAKETE